MNRRGDSRAEIFAVQSDLEEESAIETVLTDAEEDWTAVTPEPRRPRVQSRRKKSVLRQKHQRRTRDDVPWDHHEKHRPKRAPVGLSEKIERRLAEKEKMMERDGGSSESRRRRHSRSASRKPAVFYDDGDESFLSSYGGGGGDEETNVTSVSQLKRELKRMAKLKANSDKKTKRKSKKKTGSSSKKDKKKSKKGGKRRRKKRGDALEQLFKACDTSGGVHGVCKMVDKVVDKAFQLDSSSDEESSSDDESSVEEETAVVSIAESTAVTGANDTAITGFTEATSAVPSFDTTKYSGTTATGFTGTTGFTEERSARPSRRSPRRNVTAGPPPPPGRVAPNRSTPPSTPPSGRGKPLPSPSTSHKKSSHRYRQVIAPPGKLGLSLSSSPQGPKVKMVSRHCPVNVQVGDVIARVNGQSVLGMECKRVMEMFVTLSKREKLIDIIPRDGSHGGGTDGSKPPPSRRRPTTSGHPPLLQTMPSKGTPRASATPRSRPRSQRRSY